MAEAEKRTITGYSAGFDSGRWGLSQACRQTLEARRGKETDSFLEPFSEI